MLQPADLLLLDEPTNDLDIPALEVLEDSLSEFPGAWVLVSHDRELMDRLCTEVIGLDGSGGASLYGDVSQWLAAYERSMLAQKTETRATKSENAVRPSGTKPKKLSYKEQQEFEQMEGNILAAEEMVLVRQAEVERAAGAGHLFLAEACQTLEDAQRTVERLYARWQELEAKRGL